MKLFFAALTLITSSFSASAAVVTYTDRTAFESALTSFSVDDFSGIQPGTHYFADRGDYTITSPKMFGCVNVPASCGPAPAGGDGVSLFHYQGLDTFEFTSATNGFGFDYIQTQGGDYTLPIINGIQATAYAGFFGVISDVAQTTFTLNQTSAFLNTDNVTYGTISAVPLPAGGLLLISAFAALAGLRRRKAT